MNSSTFSKDTENKLNGASHSINKGVDSVTEKLEKFSNEAGKKVGSLAAKASEGAEEYVETSREYIKQNPMQATAIAAVAGVAIGFLLSMVGRRR